MFDDPNSPQYGENLDHWRPTSEQMSLAAGLTARFLDDDPATPLEIVRTYTRFARDMRPGDGVYDGLVQIVLALLATIDETVAVGDRDRLIARLQSNALHYASLDEDTSLRADGEPQNDHTQEVPK